MKCASNTARPASPVTSSCVTASPSRLKPTHAETAASLASCPSAEVSDRRYSTSRWQRLRRAVLQRDGYVCLIQGPRCLGYATTVHHLIPSSQMPELFWEPWNLAAACTRCNYGHGTKVAQENTRTRISELERIVHEQDQRIAHLVERLREYEPLVPVK